VIILAVIVLIPLGFWAVAIGRADRVTHPTAAEWARERGLALNIENTPMVAWYLRNTRVLRLAGVFAGFVLPPLVGMAIGRFRGSETFIWAYVGYLLGALYAELSLVRPPGRTATLDPRRLVDYLSGWVVNLQRALGGVTAMVAVVVLRLPRDVRPSPVVTRPWILAVAVGGAVLAIGLEAIERALVRRPQPIVSRSMVEADDAIRAQSVHSVAGSGIAIQLLLLSIPLWAAANGDIVWLRRYALVLAVLCSMGSLLMCLMISHQSWRVRRTLPVVR
jgi:hypothetical protein